MMSTEDLLSLFDEEPAAPDLRVVTFTPEPDGSGDLVDLFEDDPEPEPEQPIPTLKDCIDFLAGRCNFATSVDGAGFNKMDTDHGHALSRKDWARWTPWDKHWAFKKAAFYHRQLDAAGLRWREMEAPPDPSTLPKRPMVKRIVRIPNGFGIQYSGLDQREFDKTRYAVNSISGVRWVYWKTEDVPEEHRDYGPMPATVGLDSQAARSLRRLQEEHGFELGAGVEAQFYELIDKGEFMKKWALAVDAENFDLGPAERTVTLKGGEVLRPWGHQRAFVRYAEAADFKVLLGDEPGTGKTTSTILGLIYARAKLGLKGRILILCPKSVMKQWRTFFGLWAPELSVGLLNGQGMQIIAYDVIIANYDIVRLGKDGEPNDLLVCLMLSDIDALVCDESHNLKNGLALRTQAIKKLVEARDIPVRFLLTGTPILNRVPEFIPQLEILGIMKAHFGSAANFHREYVRYRDFKGLYDKLVGSGYMARTTDHHVITPWQEYLKLEPGRIAASVVPGSLITAEAEEEDLEKRTAIRAEIRERLERNGYTFLEGALRLKGRFPLPAPVELDDWAAYQTEHEETERWFRQMALEFDDEKAFERWMKAYALVRINKLRLSIAKKRMKEALPYIENLLEDGRKVVVATWHEEITKRVTDYFKGAAEVSGRTGNSREEEKQRFITDPDCKVMVLQILSGGEGLDGMQQVCSDIVTLEYPWNPGKLDQLERRLYRGGQKHPVICHYIAANPDVMETIDQYMFDIIDSKKGTTTAALHGADAPEDDMLKAVVNKFLGRTEAA